MRKTILVRQESFGATVFVRESGQRFYINENEFDALEGQQLFPSDVRSLIGDNLSVIIVKPGILPVDNFSSPDTVFFEVTRACNLHCTHCFNSSGVKLNDELSIAERHQVIDDLFLNGIQEIRFTGGEPLALPGIHDLILHASSLGLRVSLGSNGVLITEQLAQQLAYEGVNRVVVSLDGNETEHDKIRGAGTYKKSLNALQFLQSAGVSTRVNCVIMQSNLDSVLSLTNELILAGNSVMIRRLIPSGRASEDWQEMLSQSDYRIVEDRLRLLYENHPGKLEGHYLFEKPVQTRIPLPFIRRGCSAGHRGMVVMPNGNVQTCGFLGPLGEQSMGKLPEISIRQIWDFLNSSSHIKDMQDLTHLYNETTVNPQTNCLAMGLASKSPFAQISRR